MKTNNTYRDSLNSLTKEQLIERLMELEPQRIAEQAETLASDGAGASRSDILLSPPPLRESKLQREVKMMKYVRVAWQQILLQNEGFTKTVTSFRSENDYCETTYTILGGRLLIKQTGVRPFDKEFTADACEAASFLCNHFHSLNTDGIEEYVNQAQNQQRACDKSH